jgi:porin
VSGRPRLLMALCVGSSLCAPPAWTQDKLRAKQETNSSGASNRRAADDFRSTLKHEGIELQANYLSEAAGNITGGQDRLVREAGQLTLGAGIDMESFFAIRGGAFQMTLTWRRGSNLASDAGLNTLELVQANYGRGQTARVTQFWYQQAFAGDRIDVKLGRLTTGEDSAAFSCDFMNLSFCGARPGSVVSDYWFNWPVSQWGMRWRYRGPSGYSQIGVYEVNPKNLEETFTIGRFSGATGVLIPIEGALTPTLGANNLPGTYKIGAWYDTSSAGDIFLNVNGAPRAVTGLKALERHGRYGVYAQVRQQLTGRFDGEEASGLAVFLNVVQAERRTGRLDSQIGVGLTYTDPLHRGAHEQVGIAIGRTHVNRRAAAYDRIERANSPGPQSEYLAEFNFRYEATPWLTLQPNVQYIVSPDGNDELEDVAIVGLRTTFSF